MPLELDSDLMVAGTPLTVQVEAADVEAGTVDIAVTTGVDRGIDIHSRGGDDIITVINPQALSTPCGDPITYGTFITRTQYFYQPVRYGFGGAGAPDAAPLKARWTVAGIEAAGPDGSLDASTPDGTFTIQYAVDPVTAELSLSSRGGEKYRVDVTVTMTEADGSGTTTATVSSRPRAFSKAMRRATESSSADVQIRQERWVVTRLFYPAWTRSDGLDLADRINQARRQQLIRLLPPSTSPASALAALTVLRYGVGEATGANQLK